MERIELVCFDMAGTTMRDDGLVFEAFERTIDGLDLDPTVAHDARQYVVATMGQSKIDVFRALFADRAEGANRAFERHFVGVANDEGVAEIPGARATIESLRESGTSVALTTGFSVETREALIAMLGWGDLFEVRVSPADAGRGRPAPDMLLHCALALRISSVAALAAVGDTASDMIAGRRAGAGLCVGVLTGTDDKDRLVESGADVVLASVGEFDSATPLERR